MNPVADGSLDRLDRFGDTADSALGRLDRIDPPSEAAHFQMETRRLLVAFRDAARVAAEDESRDERPRSTRFSTSVNDAARAHREATEHISRDP